uniref:Aldehyde dehydrogenase domain-containing protein n=1 Tax=Globodera rostochiensis TaxID=31243 RepID=A0A914I8P9_GLORO
MRRFSISPDILERLHFVNGARTGLTKCRGEGEFTVYEPRNGAVLTKFRAADKASIDQIASQAHEAQRKWANVPWIERRQILNGTAHLLRRHANEIAVWEVRDNGKPISEAKADVLSCADTFEYFAGINLSGEHIPYDGECSGRFAYTRREPFGVVGAIGAWNYPIQTASWKIAPAIACGNAILYKPSPLAPISSVLLAKLLQCAGLPDGVVNIVQGGADTGAKLCENRTIKKISFTGSVNTGKNIASACAADHLKPCTLELGGKSACIVFEDADVTMAVHGAMLANFLSQGQVCSNASKVLVHRKVLEQFMQQIVHLTENMRIGDPLNECTHVGACISQQHMDKVRQFVRTAVEEEGAKLLTGGERVTTIQGLERGYFLSPCILTNITPKMAVYRHEIFGPVLLIIPFDDDEEALRMANDTEFGLAGGVFTKDLARAHKFAARMSAGNVYINTYNDAHPNVPFGGFNQSGYGRENGEASVWSYTQVKAVFVNATDRLDSPFA